ncbi:hypothetical protein AJ80_07923 [Polytolypa hystricis UAMH7299]|uniref:Uncharacterized protein n=1 Tax=Polytolypa hystricis (strain UAMH7299) TaxID=1447883 RepID=A0A2B7XGV9_POLH7|nr:hypothetical protein AJ80_07923 [Polytolypa hystricis UAMH7299]
MDALCGPSNALQNFQKHTSVDRTLQQDRLLSRQLPAQGFRTQNHNEGVLDPEFAAFEAGFSGPPLQDANHTGPLLQPRHQQSVPFGPAESPAWASDFQGLHISGPAHPITQSKPSAQAQLQHQGPRGWQDQFMRQQSQPVSQQPAFQPAFNHGPAIGSMAYSGMNTFAPQYESGQIAQPVQADAEETFDESAFEAAFAEARAEVEKLENTIPIEQETEEETVFPVGVTETVRIGSDNIPAHVDGINESDELAKTAGQLLDSVSHDQSDKFKQSNFLALMRQLRDREVTVEGDELRQMVQPLHPGGPFYPEQKTSRSVPQAGTSAPDSASSPTRAVLFRARHTPSIVEDDDDSYIAPPPHPPYSGPSSSSVPSPGPPPFSSLYSASLIDDNRIKDSVTETSAPCLPAFAPAPPFDDSPPFAPSAAAPPTPVVADTKAALSHDKKGDSSGKSAEDSEPPPPYTEEGSSPIESFTYVMAAAGGAASIITQVQQTAGPPLNSLGEIGGDEHITLDLRGTRFTLSRDELLTLPEFVLLSLFPNGLLPDGHMGSFHEGDVYPVDYDPASLQYMLDFFRTVAQSIPSSSPSPTASHEAEHNIDPMQGSARDMLQDRAGIIVLREDLDFYVIPPTADIEHPDMIEVKRAAGRALLKQDGIFSGLKKSDEAGTTEQHLIEMLTAGGFNHDDRWGHRAGEPNKAVVCSLALAKLRTDIRSDIANNNAVGMAQKLLLFWRKPARRCWWEGVELENIEGVEGKLKVWIRRVWTLEMVGHIYFSVLCRLPGI